MDTRTRSAGSHRWIEAKKFTSAAAVRRSRSEDIIVGIRASIGDKVWSDGVYCLGRGVAGLRAKDRLDQRYLWHWISHAAPTLASKGRGATFLQVNRNDLAEMEIPLPPIEEQRRIAAVLDAADELRTKRRQAIAKLDTLTQAIFIDMFGDPSSNSKGLRTAPLAELAEIINGDRGKNYPSSEFYVENGVPFVNAGHLQGGEIDLGLANFISDERYELLNSGKFQTGDILFCIRGSLGKLGVVPDAGRGAIASSLVIVRPGKQVLRDFLCTVLAGPSGRKQIADWDNGTAQPNLGAGSLGQFSILLPALAEQEAFVRTVAAIAELKMQSNLSIFDTLISSLQHRAFQGEL